MRKVELPNRTATIRGKCFDGELGVLTDSREFPCLSTNVSDLTEHTSRMRMMGKVTHATLESQKGGVDDALQTLVCWKRHLSLQKSVHIGCDRQGHHVVDGIIR